MIFRFLFSLVVIGPALAKFPTDFEFCGRRNPRLNECVKNAALAITPQIRNGLPEWEIPVLEPISIPEIKIANDTNFQAKASNVQVYGLTNYDIVSLNIDLVKGKFSLKMFVPKVHIQADYDGLTKIVVPLAGSGPMTIDAANITAELLSNMRSVERRGETYLYSDSVTLKLAVGDFKVHFKSNEDPGGTLEAAINSALSEDRENLLRMLGPNLEKAVGAMVLNLSNRVFKHASFDKLFPDRE